MTVLVAAASRHGGTQAIAERIGADLAERGLTVEVSEHKLFAGRLDTGELGVAEKLPSMPGPPASQTNFSPRRASSDPTRLA